ncbi:MAG: response regulator [Deltaproteobacteria bacterium]|nr:response regulator [Deltaproteobacteria bacterium]
MSETTIVLAVSLGVELLAAFLALRLIRSTGQKAGWALIATAAALMAVRGILALAGGFSLEPDVETELMTLCVALFMAAGAAMIGPVFREAKRTQVALAESESRFRNLFENAQIGIYRTTPGGRILMANPALTKMLRYDSFEALAARNLETEGCGPSYAREEFKRLAEQPGGVCGLEAEWTCCDGSPIFVRESAIAVRDEDGDVSYYEGTVEDVSRRRELEQQLLHAQKMDALGRLAGGVAHDFNNLLTAILGYTTLLLDRIPEGDAMRPAAEEILAAGKRAAALTSQMLIFSRRQVVQARPLDMNMVVLGMEALLRRVIGENIEMAVVLDPKLGLVKADLSQLEQVVLNLAVNARDAMPGGGRLTIETRNEDLDEEAARALPDVEPGTYVLLSVTDTGHGMTTEIRSHLFEPFFTTKEPGKGTGLGLAAVYGIVRKGNGAITVETEPGKGASFRILLPRIQATPTQRMRAAREDPPGMGTETVLLVEDEHSVRSLARTVLEKHGYRVIAAAQGEEALDHVRRYQGTIHLLVTDVVMPGMGGHQLAEHMRELRPDARVLYISGYNDSTAAIEGVLQAGAAFLQKPFTPGRLARAVRSVLDDGAPGLRPAGS